MRMDQEPLVSLRQADINDLAQRFAFNVSLTLQPINRLTESVAT